MRFPLLFIPYTNQHLQISIRQDRGPARKPAEADVVSALNIVICLFITVFIYYFISF